MGYGAPGREAIHPLDAELTLPGRLWSYECQRRLIRAVICGPFDEAITLVGEMTGTTVPKRSAEQLVQEAAVDFESFYAARAQEAIAPADGEILVGAIDCKGIPMVKPDGAQRVVRRGKGEKANKKKLATVAAVHSQPPILRTPKDVIDSLFDTDQASSERPKRPRPSRKRVWASLTAGKDAFINDVKAEMTRRDPEHQRTWVIVTDGERALQRRVISTFTDITLVLDLLHVLEKLWKVAHALHSEGSPEAEAFVRARTERILCGMAGQVVKGLRQTVTKRRITGVKAKTIHGVCDYLYRNRERMRYDEYLRNGWPIASGTVEGACKNLIRDRFERSGMRWTIPTAEALLKLRAAHLSGDLENYWEHHIQLDSISAPACRTSPRSPEQHGCDRCAKPSRPSRMQIWAMATPAGLRCCAPLWRTTSAASVASSPILSTSSSRTATHKVSAWCAARWLPAAQGESRWRSPAIPKTP